MASVHRYPAGARGRPRTGTRGVSDPDQGKLGCFGQRGQMGHTRIVADDQTTLPKQRNKTAKIQRGQYCRTWRIGQRLGSLAGRRRHDNSITLRLQLTGQLIKVWPYLVPALMLSGGRWRDQYRCAACPCRRQCRLRRSDRVCVRGRYRLCAGCAASVTPQRAKASRVSQYQDCTACSVCDGLAKPHLSNSERPSSRYPAHGSPARRKASALVSESGSSSPTLRPVPGWALRWALMR